MFLIVKSCIDFKEPMMATSQTTAGHRLEDQASDGATVNDGSGRQRNVKEYQR